MAEQKGQENAFIAWLRDSYVPSPHLIRFTSEAAFARGNETDWRVPAVGGVEQIEEELRQHLLVVVGG